MLLILARHGNTFESSELAYQVGCNQDLPLVATGRQQANNLALHLKQKNIIPDKIYTAPLQRTLEFADIISKNLNCQSVHVEHRLIELDYGQWAGLTMTQIREKFGSEELDAWNTLGQWPSSANWQMTEQTVQSEVMDLAAELIKQNNSNSTILLVSSNGRLRYFLDLIAGKRHELVQAGQLKVGTGCYCLLEYQQAMGWKLLGWNIEVQ